MNPEIQIRPLRTGELEKILPSLNDEFIFQRGRKLPLEKRYPDLFSTENVGNCFAAFSRDGEILSFAATEERTLRTPSLKIFFVGCVFTAPAVRGCGLAKKVMESLAETYRKKGFAGGFLWTGLNNFYRSLGWKVCDRTILMILRSVARGGARCPRPSESDADALAASHGGLLIRRVCDYFKVPPPADVPVRLRTAHGGHLCGGIGQSAGYVYELRADNAEELSELLSPFAAECGGREEIWINLQPEQQGEIALLRSRFPDAEIKHPALQMNLIFSEEHQVLLDGLNIPYLDRI